MPGDDDTPEINFPSGKVGAITRIKNKITRYCEENEIRESDILADFNDEIVDKIKTFDEACAVELEKEVPTEDKDEFTKWYKKHKRGNEVYMKKLEILIIENDEDDEDDEEDDEDEDEEEEENDDSKKGKKENPSKHDIQSLIEKMVSLQASSDLPKNEPEYFSGEDLMKFESFSMTFERMVEKKCDSFEDKFFYLAKYTTGEANMLVQSCNGPNMRKAYKSARLLLNETYGNHYKIAQTYLDKLQSWEEIKAEDGEALRRLATFLTTCSNTMKNLSTLNQLNSMRDIKEIVMKLPYSMRTQFRTKTLRLMNENKTVNFKTLVSFVNEQANLLNIPLLGDISGKTKPQKSTKQKSFTTRDQNNTNSCICCRKTNHTLDSCFFFQRKSLSERKDFIKKRKLCFACLEENHLSRNCTSRLHCHICKKLHPTPLHNDENTERPPPTDENPTETNMTTREGKRIMCPSIPVIITSKHSNISFKTYAALDSCSTSSYVDSSLIKKLRTSGSNKTLSVTTIDKKTLSINTQVIKDLQISSIDGSITIDIPSIYSKDKWPFKNEDSPTVNDVCNITKFSDINFNFMQEKIGLLLGMDLPEILRPIEIRESSKHGPYASKHVLGWSLNGPVKGSQMPHCYRTNVFNEINFDRKINDLFGEDFSDTADKKEFSVNDQKWLKLVTETTKVENNQFVINLPLVDDTIIPPNNYEVALKRFKTLHNKLKTNNDLREHYFASMNTMKNRGFIEIAPKKENSDEKTWYLPHHAVFHKSKKPRTVFDGSSRYKGICLNDILWCGPDLTNSIVGVLIRFRLRKIAVTGDIEKMFYMVKVPEEDRSLLKFLWFEDDIDSEMIEYQLTVHLFGATSSPAIANFALNKCAENTSDELTRGAIRDSFYVDDLLMSYDSVEDAIRTTQNIDKALSERNFNITGFNSNNSDVLKSIPNEKISKNRDCIALQPEDQSFETALGIHWNYKTDTIGYNIKLPDHPNTKRGMLATIFSIYDPLFIASPVIIKAKRLFQILCTLKLSWDDVIPDDIKQQWLQWKNQIHALNSFNIERCYSSYLEKPFNVQLHIFCDGSLTAYGACAYLRFDDMMGDVITNIVLCKVRLTPVNRKSLKTVPRIELNSAKLAVSLYEKIELELKHYLLPDDIYFWTDSMSTLQYLRSEKGEFQTFVANRVGYIRSKTKLDAWHHVPGKYNPADLLSRGSNNTEKFVNDRTWKHGPEFLSYPSTEWPEERKICSINTDDPEIKKGTLILTTKLKFDTFDKLLNSTSSFSKLIYRIATLIKFKNFLLYKTVEKEFSHEILRQAELDVYKLCQIKYFDETLLKIVNGQNLSKNDVLRKLCPFYDDCGLLRVGGRLNNAPIPYDAKFPIILHGDSLATRLLVIKTHRDIGHMGKVTLTSKLKERFHIVKLNKLLKNILNSCVICRRVHGRPCSQIMADLPPDRITGDIPPFTNTGCDLFGPFLVSKGRGHQKEKRYGVIFTCLVSRSAHIEIANSLDTDSFVNALRRFTSRRGVPKIVRSDNGTNLRAADKELKHAVEIWNNDKVKNYYKLNSIQWIFQPPNASHWGGVFEREIRSIRKILNSLLLEFDNQVKMTDDLLNTLMCEVENTLNHRPLTAVTCDGLDEVVPITPNSILRLQTEVEFPPGLFNRSDVYGKRAWRQAQFLADCFWQRFNKEYIPLLQSRQKWLTEKKSLKTGDFVLIVDNLQPRNTWKTGIVVEVFPDDKGIVRSARVKLSKICNNDAIGKSELLRPIHKLVLLMESEDC